MTDRPSLTVPEITALTLEEAKAALRHLNCAAYLIHNVHPLVAATFGDLADTVTETIATLHAEVAQ